MKLTSVNIGKKGTVNDEITGIYKLPVEGPARITTLGLEGDFIASEKHHGGPDQAVYLYGGADYDWWAGELGRPLDPGTFGENLTIAGLESARFAIGDRLTVGEVTLEVTAPRIPCATFAARMGDAGFVKRFRDAGRPGVYCRVLQEGTVRAGDEVHVEPYAGERTTLLELYRDHYEKTADEATLKRFLRAPVASRLRMDLEERLEKQG
jgi:MOSC domain-containing protein YiiM